MADYQQLTDASGKLITTVLRRADNAHIPDDPGNRDRQQYDEWLAAGYVPDPPPPRARAGVIAQSMQAQTFATARQLNNQGRTQEAVAAILDMLEQNT